MLRAPDTLEKKAGGTFTLVTDCAKYGVSLTQSISQLRSEDGSCRLFDPVPVRETNGVGSPRLHTEASGIELFKGIPAQQYVAAPFTAAGHAACESSYFDRLWKNGGGKARYFLVVQRK